MGTTKSRKSRRNNSRPTAFSFLSNISLGNESEKPPDPSIRKFDTIHSDLFYIQNNDDGALSLHSSESSFSADDEAIQASIHIENHSRNISRASPSFITQQQQQHSPKGKQTRHSDSSSPEVEHHKLTRDDSERPIASEKIKKKPQHGEREVGPGLSILSVIRYYTDKIRQSKAKQVEPTVNRSYVQQQLESHDHHKRRKAESYAHFLNTTGSLLNDAYIEEHKGPNDYDPYYLDNGAFDLTGLDSGSTSSLNTTGMKPADLKREMNEQFRKTHPEIPPEITLSKIRAIKLDLLEIGKEVDLEVSSVAHAYVYFEKLIIKNMVTKKNRKLIAACCLFLATKVNEAKGTWFKTILDAMDTHLKVDAEEIHEHEFAVFADLEFNLYVPRREFIPHFETIFHHLEHKSISDYLGNANFFNADQSVITDEV